MSRSILIIAPGPSALAVADALRHELDLGVEVAANRRTGMAALRRAEFTLVLLEESLASADPDSTELLYQNAVAAPVLEINFAISSTTRVVRQVKAALTRRAHDQQQARLAAANLLQGELKSALTGLLLESQLALREAPPAQVPKLRHLVELAGDLRNRLTAHN